MQFCGMLPEPSYQSRNRNRGRTVTSRPFVLPLDRHDAAVARAAAAARRVCKSAVTAYSSTTAFCSIDAIAVTFNSVRTLIYLSLALSSLSLSYSMPSLLILAPQSSPNAAVGIAVDAANRDTLLKPASRQRLTEISGTKIRAFLADAKLFLTLYSRLQDRKSYIVLAWLGSDKAEILRRSHVADSVLSYEKLPERLSALLGRF